MKGSFICLNEATYLSEIPKELQGRYARKKYDEDGGLVKVLDTTFKQIGVDNTVAFGCVQEFEINTKKFFILELEISWLDGGVSSLIELGSGLRYPNNTMLNKTEAIALISANTQEVL